MTLVQWDESMESYDPGVADALNILEDFDNDFGDDGASWDDPRNGRVSSLASRPSIHYVNEAGIPEDVMDRHFRRGRFGQEVASVIEKWSQSLSHGGRAQTLDVFNRTKGIKGEVHPHAVMARCAFAVKHDDVLGTLADVIEGLMWAKCRFELIDQDEQSIWNQWAKDVNLDEQLRKLGREIYKSSQFYVGLWWARKTYRVQDDQIERQIEDFEHERKVREHKDATEQRDALIAANAGNPEFVAPPELPAPPEKTRGQGNHTRRKEYKLTIPTRMTVFEPTKILPVGTLMFGLERFAYIATREEDEAFTQALNGDVADDIVLQLIERKYTPTAQDKAACAEVGVDHTRLWLFRREAIFRHTLTKADYERYAAVRLEPALELISMKDNLRSSDQASLIGNTNFIVVITKGSDKIPAKPAEIANLQEQAKVIARLPVLIGDHRLHVEIVSPTLDNTLIDARWQVLDARLVFMALRTYAPVTQGGAGSGGGAGVSEMSRVISKGLQSRRHMIMRSIESGIFEQVMARNEGELNEFPAVEFTPKRITLDFNEDIINGVLKLRDRGDISRETTLEELDYDQDIEVLRRGRERVLYDRVFESGVPFSSPSVQPFGVQPPGGPGGNVGPNGQPRTEGGRPSGVTEEKPRTKKATGR